MTYRPSDSSCRDCYSQPQSRLNQQIRCDSTDEGCPVLEESGTVCGETNSLDVFQEFRRMYDDCLKKLEGTRDGSATLKKLAPFKKLIDDLWEQNTMLVETVEELEQEATSKVTNLQDKLNKSCQKICEYKEDIRSLTEVIQRQCEKGVLDTTGLKFYTLSPDSVFSNCKTYESCSKINFVGVKTKPEPLIRNKITYVDDITSKSNCGLSRKPNGGKYDGYETTSRSKGSFSKRVEAAKSRYANAPKTCINDLLEKSQCAGFCNENNCYYRNIDRSTRVPETTADGKNSPHCKDSINANFTLGNDSLRCSECCCSCSCSFSPNEAEDC